MNYEYVNLDEKESENTLIVKVNNSGSEYHVIEENGKYKIKQVFNENVSIVWEKEYYIKEEAIYHLQIILEAFEKGYEFGVNAKINRR